MVFQKYMSPGLQAGSLGIQEAVQSIQYLRGSDSKRMISPVDESVVTKTCRSMRGSLLSGVWNQDTRARHLAVRSGGRPLSTRGSKLLLSGDFMQWGSFRNYHTGCISLWWGFGEWILCFGWYFFSLRKTIRCQEWTESTNTVQISSKWMREVVDRNSSERG